MSSQTAMNLMTVAEFALWAALGFLFWRKRLQRRFPAMGIYLALRVFTAPVLLIFFYGESQHWLNDYCDVVYFYTYWAVYLASAVLIFFICQEVFHSALAGFTGLQKLGKVVFRWAALASLIVCLTTVPHFHHSVFIIQDISFALMRSVSVLELCLLGFLCLSMNALNLSVRGMTFGIALGLGVMSSNDLVYSSFWTRRMSATAPLQFVCESVILLAIGGWITYCALPEPAPKLVTQPVSSTIYRWNEIASALGHTGTQVAVRQPASSFFLSDVEKVVERVLSRTLKDQKSET
jgi:hypothetical protein